MAHIAEIVRSLGGMAQKQQLVARGARDLDLTRAVRDGSVERARQGWYTTLSTDSAEVRAVRVGGRLTGISAVIARGGWALGDFPLHVSVHGNAARLRSQWNRHKRLDVRASRGVTLHWDDVSVAGFGSATSVGLVDALERVVLDESFETAIAALDWALHTGALDRVDLETLILRLPAGRRGIGGWVDERCESLPESLSRTRLRLAGHSVASQVPVGDDNERIDLVVDGIAGIEVDGDEYHRTRFESDRGKDVTITLDHLHAMRPSARMVFYNWDRFARAVEIALASHPPRLPASIAVGNSGTRRRDPFAARGMTGWRGRSGRRSPEFPKGETEKGAGWE